MQGFQDIIKFTFSVLTLVIIRLHKLHLYLILYTILLNCICAELSLFTLARNLIIPTK